MSDGVVPGLVGLGGIIGDTTTTAGVGADGGGDATAAAATGTSSTIQQQQQQQQQQLQQQQHEQQLPAVDDPCVYNHPDDTDEFKRSYALNYHLRRKPKALFAMAMGFPEFYGILDRPPLSTIKRKELNEQYVPKAEDFKQEIKRRSYFFMHDTEEATFYTEKLKRDHPLRTKRSSIILPQPNQWLNTQLKNWLTSRPMKPTDEDVKFIRFHIKRALDHLIQDGTDGNPEALRELPIAPTPIDAEVGPDILTASIPAAAAAAAAGGGGGGDGSGGASSGDLAGLPPGQMPLIGGSDDSGTMVDTVMKGGFGSLLSTPGRGGFAGMESDLTSITPAATDIESDRYVYEGPGETFEYKRSAAETFLLRGSKPRILFALAMGMPEYSELLQMIAYNLIKRKEVMEDFMPRAEDYKYEVKRRAHFFMNVEDEAHYFTVERKLKNPLENMRGIVTLPQPNQWKLQALKIWLSERPLRPNPKDGDFLKAAIQKAIDALKNAMAKDPALAHPLSGNKRTSTVLMNMVDPSVGTMGGSIVGGASLAHVIQKQDAVLSALRKHTEQQTLLNKITLLTQSSMGHQQELASLRSTRSDIESRILTVEMKLAELIAAAPESLSSLRSIIVKQEEKIAGINNEIADVESKISSIKSEIQALQANLDELARSTEDEDTPSVSAPPAPGVEVAEGAGTSTSAEIGVDEMEGMEQSIKKPRYEKVATDV
eukprot:CAMPEP_0113453640 /NCGR_PEP_ID=MMETSP0014_2-20120614/7458_1 /TAXON_ID=2857 /ORGANISM="Nitzschia sp." /LENGTH=712 /DNA_ID=CAMNT_0000345033 /DNA_START=267 /DNA_END=2405 /DNA_ORIENTATION=+ /assembly_acc=CAM_ASM_000159